MHPKRLLSPDSFSFGVSPRIGPTALKFLKRCGMSIVAVKASATTGPTPGTVIKRWQFASSLTIAKSFLCRRANSERSFCRAASSGIHDLFKIGHAFDEPADAVLELHRSHGTNLEPEVAKQTADVVLDGDCLPLQ